MQNRSLLIPVSGSLLVLSILIVGMFPDAQARQYLPKGDSVVVEILKKDIHQLELKTLRKDLAADPRNISLAANLAKRYISESRSTGDPRYLGYAQATLAPWWKKVNAPTDILVLRATILQSTHQFSAALADLDLVLSLDKDDPQAWLTRATVLQVMGDFAGAKTSCKHLVPIAPEIVTSACINNISSLNGDIENSYKSLVDTYKKFPNSDVSIKIWVLTLLAEISTRRGDSVSAQVWFKKAMEEDNPDSYLLGAYCDFLLDHGRYSEVVELLRQRTRVDALLLRYVIALQGLKSPLVKDQIDILEQRFEAAAMREDTVHQREHARFELQVKARSTAALNLARKNWAIQKEPADLRIYLEAAIASHNRVAALPALEWLESNKLQDKQIQKLVEKLGGSL